MRLDEDILLLRKCLPRVDWLSPTKKMGLEMIISSQQLKPFFFYLSNSDTGSGWLGPPVVRRILRQADWGAILGAELPDKPPELARSNR